VVISRGILDGDAKLVLAAAAAIHAHHQHAGGVVFVPVGLFGHLGDKVAAEGILVDHDGGIVVFSRVRLLVFVVEEGKLAAVGGALPGGGRVVVVLTEIVAGGFAVVAGVAEQQRGHEGVIVGVLLSRLRHYVRLLIARCSCQQHGGKLLLRHGQHAGRVHSARDPRRLITYKNAFVRIRQHATSDQ